MCPVSCDERGQLLLVLLCFRTAWLVWKVKLVPAVKHVLCVLLMELKKSVLKWKMS